VNLDPDKLIVLFVIALVVLGPKRMPEMARTAGRWMGEIRKYTSGIQGELHGVLGEPLKQTAALRDEFRSVLAEPRSALEVGAREVRSSFNSGLAANGSTVPSEPAGPPAFPPLAAAAPPSVAVPDDPGLN
jgi:sec-independent protein translocase protein TatB